MKKPQMEQEEKLQDLAAVIFVTVAIISILGMVVSQI